MNILIIGFGVVGKYYFKYLKKNKNVKNIFIYNNFKLPKNSKYKQIDFDLIEIKKKNIKHAIICTPSNLHHKFSKELAKNGINILIEKPFVLQIKHAKELIIINNKNNNLKCWVAFQNRCNLSVQKVKKYLIQKKIGNVFLADCSMIWSRSQKYYSVSWRGKYESDGGVLANQAIHLLDAIIYLFGEINKFNGLIKFNKKKLEAEDLISLNFEHGTNIITSFKATTRADANYRSSIDIIGEKGRLLIKGISLNTLHVLKKNKIFMDKKNSESFGNEAMGNGHQKILKEFLSSSKLKSSFNLEIKDNIHSLKVIHSIYNSVHKNNFSIVNEKQSRLGI